MPELPRGTVTFLFTDIEGSTALWERDRIAMREAVDRQLAILQSLIAAHHGVLYKTIGDGTQVAFASAEDALRTALASQRAILAEAWGELGPIRVRMALHAGEAIPDARGDYLAAPLNRLSRLLAAGHGSQILLAQTVQQLTRGALPAGTELRDLGEHRLRDLLEPERVYQLVHPDLPGDFPLLRSLDARPHNLPRQPTPFLGREREVGEVADLLRRDDTQLLTLVGPGGTGKTRLALQVAAEVLEDFTDGVFFVPLAPLADPDLVLPTIAATLGLRDEGSQPLIERLEEYLTTKQLLLALDNLEHLAAAAPAVGELLTASAGVKVLATSRMPLRLRAEREYAVPPLGLPRRKPPPTLEQLSQYEGIRLFIDRAQAVKADFVIDNANAPAVAEICWRLDGLPLAIELAAARVRMLSPQAMFTRLEQRLPMLTGGARDAPERQRTLRNTIAWSYDLLEPEEQALFRCLAVFAGGCTIEAVETVANADGSLDVFGGLERLVEQSLLRQEEGLTGEPRFTMLETIREFGLEQLAGSGEGKVMQRRHAEHYLTLVEAVELALWGPDAVAWLDRLEIEHDNLRAALRWATGRGEAEIALRLGAALSRFWQVHAHLSEGLKWLERALARTTDASSATRARALDAAGHLARDRADYDRAWAFYEESLELRRELEDRRGTALALNNLGVVAQLRGDFDHAVALHEESLALFRTLGDERGVALSLLTMGTMAQLQGDLTRATAHYEESLALFQAFGDTRGIAGVLSSLGTLASSRGDFAAADELYVECAVLFRELGDSRDIAACLSNQAGIARDRGDLDRATALARESLVLFHELSDHRGLAACLELISSANAAQGQPERGIRLLAAAETVRETTGVNRPAARGAAQERTVAALRSALSADAFARAWEAGRRLPLDEIVADALTPVELVAPQIPPSGTRPSPLNWREREVAALIARGLTNRQIAEALFIAERAADTHVEHILAKLGLGSRTQVATWVVEQGEATPGTR
jgi:predicted ATPase/class 3 adenylate cyclase/DNA-binding CsgD family transcriptional regulator